MWPECPQCDRHELHIIPSDFGVCSQTGYRDAGERWECRTCGAISDEDELRTRGREASVEKRSIEAAIYGFVDFRGADWVTERYALGVR